MFKIEMAESAPAFEASSSSEEAHLVEEETINASTDSTDIFTAPPHEEVEQQQVQMVFPSSLENVSLARCRTTPFLARVLLPLCMLGTHALFYYGQTAPMWKLRVFSQIDVWANATDFTSKRAFDAVGLHHSNHLTYDEDKDVQTFTYYYAIDHLWKAQGLPNKTLAQMAAVLLIIFSGFWPHIKLFWLNMTWFFGKHQRFRTNTLHWLSTLGKWSLADVLVVCVMVGVLHLDWIVEPDAIKQGVITDLPSILKIVESLYSSHELCDKLLKMDCAAVKKIAKITKCKACQQTVKEAYTHPEWARSTGANIVKGVDTSGGGLATLRVVGMRGIYAFCGAVIISILLSLIVDIFDHRVKQEIKREHQRVVGHQRMERVFRQQQQANTTVEDNLLQEPLLGITTPAPLELDLGSEGDLPPSTTASTFSWKILVFTLFTIAIVFYAVDIDTMERKVHGAGPMLLHDVLGIDWETPYSLRALMWTTGAAGSWDYLLMGTFALFCVLGPAIRAVLLVITTMIDRCCQVQIDPLATAINFIGSFCSWEVFAIAIVMVQMLMPSITNTIVNNPACGSISDDGSCLQVEFNILPVNFAAIVVGGLFLVVTSWLVVRYGTDQHHAGTSTDRRNGLSNVMAANHNYQRIGERTSESTAAIDDGMQELVFETNQV